MKFYVDFDINTWGLGFNVFIFSEYFSLEIYIGPLTIGMYTE